MVDTTSVPATNGERSAASDDTVQAATSDHIIQIRYATALGWAMTELLGRCVVLKRELIARAQKDDHLPIPNFKECTVILSPIRDQRERARAVMGRILFLAEMLGIADCKIDQHYVNGSTDPELKLNSPYTDALNKKVGALCHDAQKTVEDIKDISAKINWLLYYWTKIVQVKLQELPPEVYNGYTVGRGFSTIRWYIGIGADCRDVYQTGDNKDNYPAEISLAIWFIERFLTLWHPKVGTGGQNDLSKTSAIWFIERFPTLWHPKVGTGSQNDLSNALISEASLDKLLDHLLSLSSFLPPLVPRALEYSLIRWGKTIILYPRVWRSLAEAQNGEAENNNTMPAKKPETHDEQKNSELEKNMKRALIKQAIIWHDLLTGERDPTTFIEPSAITRRYVGKLLLYSLPFLVLGLVFAFVIAFAIIRIQNLLSLASPTTGAPNTTTKTVTDTVTSAIVTIITAATTIPFIRTLWMWGSKTTTAFVSKNQDKVDTALSTAGKDALSLFWHRAQQEEVTAKTFVSPLSKPPDVDDGD